MGLLDIGLLLLVALGVGLALRAIRNGRSGGCCGDCARCGGCGRKKEN